MLPDCTLQDVPQFLSGINIIILITTAVTIEIWVHIQ